MAGNRSKGGAGCLWLSLIVALVLVGVPVIGLMLPPSTEEEEAAAERKAPEASAKREQACEKQGTMPAIMAANFVKRELRSPSTARFGSSLRASIQYEGSCRWTVANFVDAQNAFGATTRQNFSAKMRYDPESGNWGMSDLQFY